MPREILTRNERRYRSLMAQAAQGDRKAARALIVGDWWPGDPDSALSIDKVIRRAQNETKEN